jgi:hypothetical protein
LQVVDGGGRLLGHMLGRAVVPQQTPGPIAVALTQEPLLHSLSEVHGSPAVFFG